MALDSVQMQDVGLCLSKAFQHQLANTMGESKKACMQFVFDVVLKKKPFMMATDQGVDDLINAVFTNTDVRDFVLSMTYNFYAYWGGEAKLHDDLAESLAMAAGVQVPSLIPKPITERMVSVQDVQKKLINNRWLCVLMLMPVWIEAPDGWGEGGTGE